MTFVYWDVEQVGGEIYERELLYKLYERLQRYGYINSSSFAFQCKFKSDVPLLPKISNCSGSIIVVATTVVPPKFDHHF